MTGKAWMAAGALAVAGVLGAAAPAMAADDCGWPTEPATTATVIYFATDSTSLTAAEQLGLMAVAEQARHTHARAVCVRAQADKQGHAGYNAALAQRRADAVAKLLAGYGVPQAAIHTEAHGEAFGHSLDGLLWPAPRDRYVEVVLRD
jgi:outer membrane protein OmpA-like peptidoglycan-associated protein